MNKLKKLHRIKGVYPSKRYCKQLEKKGLYIRRDDEPTRLGYFLQSLDYTLYLFRKKLGGK